MEGHQAFSPIPHLASPTYFDPLNQIPELMQNQQIGQFFPFYQTPITQYYQTAREQSHVRTYEPITSQITSMAQSRLVPRTQMQPHGYSQSTNVINTVITKPTVLPLTFPQTQTVQQTQTVPQTQMASSSQSSYSVNQFENVNLPQSKLVKSTQMTTNSIPKTQNEDFRNKDGSYDFKAMAMYYKGIAISGFSKTSKLRGNYGKLDPPNFVEDE